MALGLNLSLFDKELINEISTLSDLSEAQIREVLELTFVRQVEQYMKCREDKKSCIINIPFLGKLMLKYKGDSFVSGSREAELDVFMAPSDLLRRLIGDIEDGESEILNNLLKKECASILQDDILSKPLKRQKG